MGQDLAIVLLSLALGLSPLVLAALRRRRDGSAPAAVGLLSVSIGAFVLGMIWTSRGPTQASRPAGVPRVVRDDGYVGSDACIACHPSQHATWHASYHRTMTQLADPGSVLAPFDGREIELEGTIWRVERRGKEHWVTGRPAHPTTDAAGAGQIERRVVMTTGSHNYQMYWLESSAGLERFPFVYLLRDRAWVPRKSRFLMPPREHTPRETGRWKAHCIKCHATRGIQDHAPSGETRVVELGIACEACHGPGAEHVERNRSPLVRYRSHLAGEPDPTIVNPSRLDNERSTQVCGQCHAIEIFLSDERARQWIQHGTGYRPGDDLERFQTIVAGRYEDNPPAVRRYLDGHPVFRLRYCFWPDGMLRVTGREYNAMLETPCYRRGEMSCHAMHREDDDPRPLKTWAADQLAPEMGGDRACLQCHEKYAARPVLLDHTRHRVDSTGSRCLNCHMPYTSWGLLGAIRSHTIDSPSAATSVATGRPNACNQCHLDRTLLWTAETLEEWYGIDPPELSEEERTIAASILWTLSGDAVQRALMAWSMGWEPARRISGTQWMAPYLGTLMLDPYDAVRYRAQRSLRTYPEFAAAVADAGVVADKERQREMMIEVLSAWHEALPDSFGERGAHLLVRPDNTLDGGRFERLTTRRDDTDVVLFE